MTFSFAVSLIESEWIELLHTRWSTFTRAHLFWCLKAKKVFENGVFHCSAQLLYVFTLNLATNRLSRDQCKNKDMPGKSRSWITWLTTLLWDNYTGTFGVALHWRIAHVVVVWSCHRLPFKSCHFDSIQRYLWRQTKQGQAYPTKRTLDVCHHLYCHPVFTFVQTLNKLWTFALFWIISRDKRFASQQKYFPRNKRGQWTLAKFIFLRPAKKFVCQLFLAVIHDLTKFYQTHRFVKICWN